MLDDRDQRRQWVSDLLTQGKAFRSLRGAEREHLADSLSDIIDYCSDAAGGEVKPDNLFDAIDFPDFVSSLIQGVFQSLVDASIKQLEAYQDLLNSVAQTVDQFRKDTITDTQAIDFLTTTFPDVFVRPDSNGRTVERRRQATDDRWDLALALLGLSETTHKMEQATLSKNLVDATRRHLLRERQQLVATVIFLGIQRIVEPEGRCRPRFKLQLEDLRKKKSPSRSRE